MVTVSEGVMAAVNVDMVIMETNIQVSAATTKRRFTYPFKDAISLTI